MAFYLYGIPAFMLEYCHRSGEKAKKNRRDFNASLIDNYSRLLKNMFELEIFQFFRLSDR